MQDPASAAPEQPPDYRGSSPKAVQRGTGPTDTLESPARGPYKDHEFPITINFLSFGLGASSTEHM